MTDQVNISADRIEPQQAQKLFMEACGQSTTTFNIQQALLYARLLNEEYAEEFVPALNKFLGALDAGQAPSREIVAELFDACGDVRVVAEGFVRSLGVDPEEIATRIWKTNLAKLGPAGQVLRRADGKILKPPGWEPPQFLDLADAAMGVRK